MGRKDKTKYSGYEFKSALIALQNLIKEGDLSRGINECKRLIKKEPLEPMPQNIYGVVLANLGNLGEAEIAFKKAVSLDSNYDEAWCNLGELLIAVNKPSEAVQALLTCVRISPDSFEYLYKLGRALAKYGKR